ncbi:MAG: hypothetical protein J6A77_01215 [Lachnospiraceae bacterium]|nr:hypothetical protein [Lachnospiraceae bacterium]
MLALDENNKICEFENSENLTVCGSCHNIYRQVIKNQIPGFREKEEDVCPVCGNTSAISMEFEYINSKLSIEDIKGLKRKSLIKEIINYCHQQYTQLACTNCEHQGGCPGECEGNCKKCLEEVHYPKKYPNGMKDYSCERMLNFYVCDYTAKYASEILYLMRKSEALKQIDDYHVLSIGCGGCPDLMAFEKYCHEKSFEKTVSYIGIDVNERWKPIHEQIETYNTKTLRKIQFQYKDAVEEECNIACANVIVLQYVISHFYNTGQIGKIEAFFEKLIDNIIEYRQQGKPLVVLINDVNSYYRGRDYFEVLVNKLTEKGIREHSQRYYFDYNIQHDGQRYGIKHEKTQILYKLPEKLNIYEPWEDCSSAQMLIEVS